VELVNPFTFSSLLLVLCFCKVKGYWTFKVLELPE
jgi:hypothetical protein